MNLPTDAKTIPVGVSAHHVHLTREDVDVLFGPGHELSSKHDLTQPGQFVARETVELVGPRNSLGHVAIVGPVRAETQIELARTDAVHLGVEAPVRESGELSATPGLKIRGPQGERQVAHGVIVAQRHIHMSPAEALRFGVRPEQKVRVRVHGARPLVLEDVVVRVSDRFALDLHLDTDEANAAGADANTVATLVAD